LLVGVEWRMEAIFDEALDRALVVALLSEPRSRDSATSVCAAARGRTLSQRGVRVLQAVRQLADDGPTFMALALMYDARRVVEGDVSVPWSAQADRPVTEEEARSESVGAVLARRHLAKGLMALKVPHLRVPWAMLMGETMYKRYRVQLVKASWGNCGGLRRRGVAATAQVEDPVRLIGEPMYAPLCKSDADYNRVMMAAIERRFGAGSLERTATLAKIVHVNRMLETLRREMSRTCNALESAEQNLRRAATELPRPSPRLRQARPRPQLNPSPDGRGHANPGLTIRGLPVVNAGGGAAKRQIVNGSIVEMAWFAEFQTKLKARYGISVEPLGAPSARAHGLCERDTAVVVDRYLMDRFGTRWVDVFPRLSGDAKLASLQGVADECKRSQADNAVFEEALLEAKDRLVARAVELECRGASLVSHCALVVAQNRDGAFASDQWGTVPRTVWKRVEQASHRIKALADGAPLQLSSFAPV